MLNGNELEQAQLSVIGWPGVITLDRDVLYVGDFYGRYWAETSKGSKSQGIHCMGSGVDGKP